MEHNLFDVDWSLSIVEFNNWSLWVIWPIMSESSSLLKLGPKMSLKYSSMPDRVMRPKKSLRERWDFSRLISARSGISRFRLARGFIVVPIVSSTVGWHGRLGPSQVRPMKTSLVKRLKNKVPPLSELFAVSMSNSLEKLLLILRPGLIIGCMYCAIHVVISGK